MCSLNAPAPRGKPTRERAYPETTRGMQTLALQDWFARLAAARSRIAESRGLALIVGPPSDDNNKSRYDS